MGSSNQIYKMYIKCASALLRLVGAVLCDNSGYSAPAQNSYSAPAQNSYSAPAQNGYSAPAQTGYGATGGASYAAPDSGYGAPAYDYGYTAPEDEGGLSLGKLEELLPLFLAVLAAIILASLLSPLLSQLFVIIVGLLPMALNIKAPIVNALLAPLGFTLCNPVGPAVFPAAGRSLGDELGVSAETARILEDTYATVIEQIQNHFM